MMVVCYLVVLLFCFFVLFFVPYHVSLYLPYSPCHAPAKIFVIF